MMDKSCDNIYKINTRIRYKISMQIVLTALIFRHKQVVPQVCCQKSNSIHFGEQRAQIFTRLQTFYYFCEPMGKEIPRVTQI